MFGMALIGMMPTNAYADSVIYVGGIYEAGADGRADRQIYDVAEKKFDNHFGSSYSVGASPGYMLGIGGNNFSIEYRVNENQITPSGGQGVRFAHSNIVLTGRSSIGTRRGKVGIGIGNAMSPAKGDPVLATERNYRTTTYLVGYDFVPGGGELIETRHGFFVEYQSVIARSGTYREVDNNDISVRETLRYTQFVLGYVFRFDTAP